MIVTLLIFSTAYFIFILFLILGWRRGDALQIEKEMGTALVSVIVPFRNEAPNLPHLFSCLQKQSYPAVKFEVVFVNDHSTDDSEFVFKNIPLQFSLLHLPSGVHGKKNALQYGISQAKGELLVFTDADCTMESEWLSNMASAFENEKVKLVLGPVDYSTNTSIFSKFETLDFLSLVASGGALCNLGFPVYGNAANMAVRKNIFDEISEPFNNKRSSGDDVFLVHAVHEKYKFGVLFLQLRNALVSTQPVGTFREFLSQRLRWASKSGSYRNVSSILISFLVLSFNVTLFAFFLIACFNVKYSFVLGIGLLVKTIADIVFFSVTLPFFNKFHLVRYVVPFQFFYFAYIVIIGFASFFISPTWKGRKVS